MYAGKLGSLIATIQENKFKVIGLKMQKLGTTEAEQFFQAYKGVWDDYPVTTVTISFNCGNLFFLVFTLGAYQAIYFWAGGRIEY